jgi:hypothetical protein
MIRKSVKRFSEKIMPKQEAGSFTHIADVPTEEGLCAGDPL